MRDPITGELVKFEDFIKQEMSMIDKVFDKYVSKFIFKFKIYIVIISLLWFAFSLWRAFLIESISKTE